MYDYNALIVTVIAEQQAQIASLRAQLEEIRNNGVNAPLNDGVSNV